MKIDRRISIDVSDEIRRLTPILGKEKATRLETAYLLADEETRKKILEMIDALKAAVFSDEDLKTSVLMEPPTEDLVKEGEIELGMVLYGKKKLYPLKIKRETLLTHMGIFGSSGYGKTNLAQWLTINLAKLNIPVIIFDFSKRNYRDLLTIPELKEKIQIFTVGRNVSPFRFNPLRPPDGVEITQWAKEFSEVFDHAYWMMGGGRHIILKALGYLYENFKPWPKISDLKEWLNKYRLSISSSRERNWVATAERPLESLCFRELGLVFECEEGILPSEFLKEGRITILELDALSTNDKTFFIEIMLQWLRDYLLVSNVREVLRGVIILEEAHHVLNREKSRILGTETVIDLIFREVRELGMGIVYIDQHPSLISYPALGNTSTHIYMNLGLDTKHTSDILDASNMLGLKYEEEGNYLRRLPIGHAFILMRNLAFPNPFLVEFPLVGIKKGSITDEMIKEFMQTKVLEEIKRLRKEEVKTKTKEVKTTEEEIPLDQQNLRIIEALGKAEGSASSEIYNKLRMSGSTFKKRAQDLIDFGLINFCLAKVYKQKAKFYFLTEKGEKFFKEKFGEFKEEMSVNPESIVNYLITQLSMQGFKPIKTNEDRLVFEKGGKRFTINLVFSARLKEIEPGEEFFICASQKLRNYLVQQVARFCFENKLSKVIHVTDLDKLKEKEGKVFERIEFVQS